MAWPLENVVDGLELPVSLLARRVQHNLQDATREFSLTVRLSPEDPYARFNLGIALASLGQVDESIAQLSAAVRSSRISARPAKRSQMR